MNIYRWAVTLYTSPVMNTLDGRMGWMHVRRTKALLVWCPTGPTAVECSPVANGICTRCYAVAPAEHAHPITPPRESIPPSHLPCSITPALSPRSLLLVRFYGLNLPQPKPDRLTSTLDSATRKHLLKLSAQAIPCPTSFLEESPKPATCPGPLTESTFGSTTITKPPPTTAPRTVTALAFRTAVLALPSQNGHATAGEGVGEADPVGTAVGCPG